MWIIDCLLDFGSVQKIVHQVYISCWTKIRWSCLNVGFHKISRKLWRLREIIHTDFENNMVNIAKNMRWYLRHNQGVHLELALISDGYWYLSFVCSIDVTCVYDRIWYAKICFSLLMNHNTWLLVIKLGEPMHQAKTLLLTGKLYSCTLLCSRRSLWNFQKNYKFAIIFLGTKLPFHNPPFEY